jgi:thiol-disulfide isomerase/thioredoxin
MQLLIGLIAALGAIAIAAALGLAWRARTGRARRDQRELRDVAAAFGPLGDRATLLQFSTELCAPCRATRRLFEDLAGRRDGVSHLEVDLTGRADLARRLNILQTPTTFVLDPAGRSRARVGGAPRIAEITAVLDALTEESSGVRAA